MSTNEYTVVLAGEGFTVAKGEEGLLYEEVLRTPLLERQSPEDIDGSLDYGVGWPYSQRDWILGEQQYHSHEHDDLRTSSGRRYQEGHGVDNSKAGELKLLKTMARTLAVQSQTLPLCVSKDGATIYAFPSGTTMRKYNAGSWTSETITGVTSPVLDCVNAGGELYIIDSNASGSRVRVRSAAGAWSLVTPHANFASTVFNDATAVVWTNGELYVLTPDELYANDVGEVCSDWTGGSIACSHAGGVFFSDGSNRVYLYNGQGTRLILEDLPTGFQVQYLFSAHARLWICGMLPDGKSASYWYAQGQWGAHAWWEPAAGSTRSIKGGAAEAEHVLFADSRYGGVIRHYSPEGGVSHYLAYGSDQAIPYKGLVVGASTIALAIYNASAGIAGVYTSASTYVASGTVTGSEVDMAMPGHLKQWITLGARFQPLTTGQSIKFEISYDGGSTWTVLGTCATVGTKEQSYQLTGSSHTAQWRLTLYPGASATTTPVLLSITLRGNPVVLTGRRWNIILDARDTVGTLVGNRIMQDANNKVDTLIEAALAQEPTEFVDIRGNTYKVIIRPFSGKPVINQHGFYQAGRVALTLDQIEGDE